MEYTMRSCVYNTTVNNAMPVSGTSFLLLSGNPPLKWNLATSLSNGGKGQTEKACKKERRGEIRTSLAHVKELLEIKKQSFSGYNKT